MGGRVGRKPIDQVGETPPPQAKTPVGQVGKLSTGERVKQILLAPFKAIYDIFAAIGKFFSRISESNQMPSVSQAVPNSSSAKKASSTFAEKVAKRESPAEEEVKLTAEERTKLKAILSKPAVNKGDFFMLLSIETTKQELMEFAKKRHADENINFLAAMSSLEELDPEKMTPEELTKLQTTLNRIVDKYKDEINIRNIRALDAANTDFNKSPTKENALKLLSQLKTESTQIASMISLDFGVVLGELRTKYGK